MSLRNYKSKTKPALWTTMKGGLKPNTFHHDATVVKKEGRKPSAAVLRTLAQPSRVKRIAPRSKKMAAKMAIYRKQKAEFLKARPYCFACKQIRAAIVDRQVLGATVKTDAAIQFFLHSSDKPHLAEDIHHRRSRAGSLLLDQRFWSGVCRKAHHFIGEHPGIARSAGLLCEPGEWNKPEPK